MREALREKLLAIWEVHRRGRYRVAHVLLIAVTLVLCFVPLLNLLGYEFSLAITIALCLVLGPVTMGGLERGSEESGESEPAGPAKTFLSIWGHNTLLLVLPVVLILLNGLRVRVCDVTGGFGIYVLIPGVSAAWCTLVGMAAHGITNGRRVLRQLTYYGLLLASVAGTAAQLALEPPIVAVNPWLAYFAGSIYDEALGVPTPLLIYRILQCMLITALVLGMEAAWRRRSGRPWGRRAMLAGGLFAVVLWGHSHHAEFGYSLDREDIQQVLGGKHESEHFIIYYPAQGEWPKRIEEVAADHEFRYAQLKDFFESEPDEKIVSYIYPDRERKGQLMGARNTLVAKLWLGEMHILYESYGNDVLKHEMAHIFTARWGTGPLDLSTRYGLFPNMGLVEGIASAAEWRTNEMTPHGWSKALHELKLAPDLERVLGAGGFWSQHNRTVYTLVGSFARWLIEEKGIETFMQAYGDGDFEGVYGVPLGELVAGWRAFLEAYPDVSEAEVELARYYFDRPSIFGKVCARNLAERKRAAMVLRAAGRDDEAVSTLSGVVEEDPNNTSHTVELVNALVQAGRLQEARERAEGLLARDGIGVVMLAKMRQTLGDILWREGNIEEARLTFRRILDETPGLPPGDRRAIEVRIYGLEHEPMRALLFEYFLGDQDPATVLARLYERREALAGEVEPVLEYLLGLRLRALEEYASAIRAFERAAKAGLPTRELTQNATFMLGECYFFSKAWAKAERVFASLETGALREGERARARDWRERVQWHGARASTDGPDVE